MLSRGNSAFTIIINVSKSVQDVKLIHHQKEYIMGTTVEQLVSEAMTLPGESRARLADLLVESLEAEDIDQIAEAWISAAKRRRDDVRAGRIESISGEEALQQVRDSIR